MGLGSFKAGEFYPTVRGRGFRDLPGRASDEHALTL
jgi:hypothetical protein